VVFCGCKNKPGKKDQIMKQHYNYNGPSYRVTLQDFAAKLGVSGDNNILITPPGFATGYARAMEVQPGVEALLVNAEYHTDILYTRRAEADNYLLLTFTDSDIRRKYSFTIAGDVVEKEATVMSSVFLSCVSNGASFDRPAGMKERSLYVLLTNDWLSQYLNISRASQLLCEYLSHKASVVDAEPLGPAYRVILDQLFDVGASESIAPLYLQNRVLQLVELFFTRLRKNPFFTNQGILQADSEKLQMAGTILSQNTGDNPPTIPEIARKVGMSPTNLKKKFKQVFGMGLYEYYRQHRLHKAKYLLESGRYSVKEVMLESGYQSASNFTLAFKKMFRVLPSQCM
jgi:AraC-like DNA-binding protein